MKTASLDVMPLLKVSTSPFICPCSVIALSSVPPSPYLSGLARLCIMRTASEISTLPSQLVSPHTVTAGDAAVEDVVSAADVTVVVSAAVVWAVDNAADDVVSVSAVVVVVVVEAVSVAAAAVLGTKPVISLKMTFSS